MASEERQKPERPLPTVYEWEGELVIINYTGGPFPGSPWDIQQGSLEARSGLFGLDEVSDLGVMARKVRKGGEIDDPVFIPWGSVHSISVLNLNETEGDAEEAGQPEPE